MAVLNTARCIVSGLFIVVIIAGCTPMQTERLLRDEKRFPPQLELTAVPFFAQEKYQCGPASLAMMLQAVNIVVTPDELVPKIFLPNREGSLQVEILATARQYDVIPYVLNKNIVNVLTEVQAGHPVLILQNLGLSWLPTWHYAVVIGFDFTSSELILRSGTEARHRIPMKVFERTWARGDYWAVVMLTADSLPQTVELTRYLEAVAIVERMQKYNVSSTAYRTALKKWPDNLVALIGLGNSYAALGNHSHAAEIFRMTTQRHPQSADAFNNLADSLLQLEQYDDALVAVRQAVAIGGKHKELYMQTEREIMAKKNN
jgi:tetratricopeptide (TPR) repeat protein